MPLFCKSKLFNIKLTWVVKGMMDVLYVYCFKSVGNYKHKLSRIESLVILYWGINCSSQLLKSSAKIRIMSSPFLAVLSDNLPYNNVGLDLLSVQSKRP